MSTDMSHLEALAKAASSKFPHIKYKMLEGDDGPVIEVDGWLYITPDGDGYLLEEAVYSPGSWDQPSDVDIVESGREQRLFDAVLHTFVRAVLHEMTNSMEAQHEARSVANQAQYRG
jgi:hypothetical protein